MTRGVVSAICLRYKLSLRLWALFIPDLRCPTSTLQWIPDSATHLNHRSPREASSDHMVIWWAPWWDIPSLPAPSGKSKDIFQKACNSLQSLALSVPRGLTKYATWHIFPLQTSARQYKAQEAELLVLQPRPATEASASLIAVQSWQLRTPHFVRTEQIFFFQVQNMMIPKTWEAYPMLRFLPRGDRYQR